MGIQPTVNKQLFSKELADEIDNNIVGFNIDEFGEVIAISARSKGVYALYGWDYICSNNLTPAIVARDFLGRYYNRDTTLIQ